MVLMVGFLLVQTFDMSTAITQGGFNIKHHLWLERDFTEIALQEHKKHLCKVIRVDNAYNHIQVRPDDNK